MCNQSVIVRPRVALLSRPVFLLFIAAMLLSVSACTPRYDWRELTVADGVARVAFPARPKSETRDLPVEGQNVPFTLMATSANGSVFAVGHMDLPAEVGNDPKLRAKYVEAMETSLTRNLHATETTRARVEVPFLQARGRAPVIADELTVHGSPEGKPIWMLARVLSIGNRLIQVAAIGSEEALDNDTARIFVDSLRLH